jgi:rhodanese-related sulfurtransferase
MFPLIFASVEGDTSSTDLAHALCLPVQVKDIIPRPEQSVKYFVIDCRSPDQYNSGHLSTAFHLDCSLMLQDKTAFEIAVDALLTVQKQAIDANSVAGGNHFCFLGSGRNDEDSYVYMVVASFLQKNYKFVSLCTGGYDALHDHLRRKHQENFLADHDPAKCSCCQSRSSSSLSSRDSDSFASKFYSHRESDSGQSTSIFDKFSAAVKSKSSEVKGKLAEFVSQRDKYKGLSLFDDSNDEYNFGDDIVDEIDEEVPVDQWATTQESIAVFACRELNQDHSLHER